MVFVILVLLNLPSYIVLGWLFYGTWTNFVDAIWSSFNDDDGEDAADATIASFKLISFAVTVAALLVAEYRVGCWIFSV